MTTADRAPLKKISKAKQKKIDELYNAIPVRGAKYSRKSRKREKDSHCNSKSKIGDHGTAVGSAINSLTEIIPIIDNDLIFTTDRNGSTITVAHLGIGIEVTYKRAAYDGIQNPTSITQQQIEVLNFEDKTWNEFNGKHRYTRGEWVEDLRRHPLFPSKRLRMHFPKGGAVRAGSPDGHDCIPALLDEDDNNLKEWFIGYGEHIVTKSEIEGLGFGSISYGHHVLERLRNHWRHRGRFYAKRR